VVAEHGFELVGHDRQVVGEPAAAPFKRVTRGGFSTRKTDQGLVAETMENADRVRYRVEGTSYAGTACQVRFVVIHRTGGSPSEERSRDPDVELALLRRVESDEASRIESDAKSAPGRP